MENILNIAVITENIYAFNCCQMLYTNQLPVQAMSCYQIWMKLKRVKNREGTQLQAEPSGISSKGESLYSSPTVVWSIRYGHAQ